MELINESRAPSRELSGSTQAHAEVSSQALGDEICGLASRISTATARLLFLVSEFDARQAWAEFGVKSCAHWLSWRCHIGVHAAREQVRVARALRELPLMRAEFGTGRLSYGKVRALTRIATPGCESDLVSLGLSGTAAQVERTVAGWRRVDASAEPDHAAKRALSWHFDDDGMLVVSARLDVEEGAVLLAAIEAVQAREAARASAAVQQPPSNQPPPAEPMPALDALLGLARAHLNGDRDTGRDPDIELVVQLDAAVLHRDVTAGRAVFDAGGNLTPEQARRLACDSKLMVILKDGPDILDVGRARTIPKALRRALLARDGGCAAPGCTEQRSRRLHAHHVWHWADGGPTCLENLVILCKAHHYAAHHGGLVIAAIASGRFEFRAPNGRLMQPVPAFPTAQVVTASIGSAIDAGGQLRAATAIAPSWKGQPLNLDYVLATLMARRELALKRGQVSKQARAA